MKVINLFAGAGAGKSTLGASLFERMKIAGFNVELVTEYAKDMVWEQRSNILDDQLYILAKQNRRLHRLRESVDWVITDSPLLFGLIYAKPGHFMSFRRLVFDIFNSYDNVNIRLLRAPNGYSSIGRVQGSVKEAEAVDDQIEWLLKSNCIKYDTFGVCEGISQTIFEFLFPSEIAHRIELMRS